MGPRVGNLLKSVMVGVLATTAALCVDGRASAQDGAVSPEILAEGEALYLKNCRQCHGTKGTAGTPLKANAKLENADFVVETILVGPGYMTGFAEHLNDEEIALLATFVRNNWGNEFGAVSPDIVTPHRK